MRLQGRRTIFLLALRVITLFIVPIIFSAWFSNDCFRYWTHYWSACTNNPEQFNIYEAITVPPIGHEDMASNYISVLSSKDICSPNQLEDINVCVRQVFHILGLIAVPKMLTSAFITPVIIVAHSFVFYCVEKHFRRSRVVKRDVDGQFSDLLTYIGFPLAFGFIIPIIIPLSYFAVVNNAFALRIHEYLNINVRPISYHRSILVIYGEIFLGQLLMALFFYPSQFTDIPDWIFYFICVYVFFFWTLFFVKECWWDVSKKFNEWQTPMLQAGSFLEAKVNPQWSASISRTYDHPDARNHTEFSNRGDNWRKPDPPPRSLLI